MNEIKWHVGRFSSLNLFDLYALLKLRQDVFVLEQSCLYPDMDNQDQEAVHVLAWREKHLLAYSRILGPGTRFHCPSIGRVIVESTERSAGLGSALMRESIRACRQHFPDQEIRISAQRHLEAFYRELGFSVASKPYDEDGIAHIEMRLLSDHQGYMHPGL